MLNEAPLAALAEELRADARSLDAYVETLRDRLADVEPSVEAFVPEASRSTRIDRAIADRQEAYPDPAGRPTLYGVPVGVKDIYHVNGLPTEAGAAVPAEELTGPEGSIVDRLRSAGAFVLGKTVTTEFAFYDPGPTRNPHDLEHTPGGSSSGSAAAVAAGLCPLALGTQTYGSVNRPASFCGVVGVKPSYGRIPMDGVIPLAPSADHPGYFTQDAAGAAIAASVIYPDWRPVDPDRSPTLGVPTGQYLDQAESRTVDHFENVVDGLDAAGFEIERLRLFEGIDAVNDRHHRMAAAEAAMVHERWYPDYESDYGPELSALIEEGYEVLTRELARGRTGRIDLRETIETAMDDHDLDLLISPSAPGPAPEGIDDTGDPVMNVPWTHSGVPTVSLPAGRIDGLPIGLQCAARFGFDEWLLAWATELEAALEEAI